MSVPEVSFTTCAALFVCIVVACTVFLSVFVFCISEVFIPLARACETKLLRGETGGKNTES